MESESSKSPNKAIIGLIVVVLLIAAATAVIILGTGNKETTDTSSTASTESTASASPEASTSTTTDSTSTTSFKDGSYNATGSYQTPGGRESIGVQVTLANGVITDASVTQQGKTSEAEEYQAAFAAGFKSQVVGKKIDEVSLSRVAGSSLTPAGFNNAIDDIETQAKV